LRSILTWCRFNAYKNARDQTLESRVIPPM
jgi:hypothetical protein